MPLYFDAIHVPEFQSDGHPIPSRRFKDIFRFLWLLEPKNRKQSNNLNPLEYLLQLTDILTHFAVFNNLPYEM
jgi:hypothetical protein